MNSRRCKHLNASRLLRYRLACFTCFTTAIQLHRFISESPLMPKSEPTNGHDGYTYRRTSPFLLSHSYFRCYPRIFQVFDVTVFKQVWKLGSVYLILLTTTPQVSCSVQGVPVAAIQAETNYFVWPINFISTSSIILRSINLLSPHSQQYKTPTANKWLQNDQ
jgi:hypothetical protein